MTHPNPPDDLPDRALPIRTLDAEWWRCHRDGNGAIYFGASGYNRYDAPGQEYGIMYVAAEPGGAFVETLLRNPNGRQARLTEQAIAERHFTKLTFSGGPLNLVDLTGAGLARLGADGRLTGGEPYSISQAWALAFWGHPSRPDGILYRSRHDPSLLCCGVFDRRQGDCSERQTIGALTLPSNAQLYGELLTRYDVALL